MRRRVSAGLVMFVALCLSSPAAPEELDPPDVESDLVEPAEPDASSEDPDAPSASSSASPAAEPVEEHAMPITLLGETLEPGSLTRLELRTSESFAGSWLSTPVAVIHGSQPGPRLCVVAGVHGDEVNGVDVVRQLLRSVKPTELNGTVIAVPIANLSAFRRGSRYLPDRRDLNRFFPGRPFGSSASRIAFGIFENVVRHCDALVDLHTGTFHRSNVHQLRANLSDPATATLSHAFGAEVVVNNSGRVGTLRRAATDVGIPAITVEAGESARFDAFHVAQALEGIMRLLSTMGMIEYTAPSPPPSPTAYLRTRWLRCDHGGILVSRVQLGDEIFEGQTIGTISDPLSDEMTTIKSPISGRVIGIAIDQVVMPGFAAFHVGYDPKPFGGASSSVDVQPEVGSQDDPEGMDLEERPE